MRSGPWYDTRLFGILLLGTLTVTFLIGLVALIVPLVTAPTAADEGSSERFILEYSQDFGYSGLMVLRDTHTGIAYLRTSRGVCKLEEPDGIGGTMSELEQNPSRLRSGEYIPPSRILSSKESQAFSDLVSLRWRIQELEAEVLALKGQLGRSTR